MLRAFEYQGKEEGNMPRGPNGERDDLADVVGCAVTVAKIATGEIEEDLPAHRYIKVRRRQGQGRQSMTPEERSELARTAARARWR